MVADVDFNISGLDGVVEKLKTLSPKLQKKGLRTATRKAMGIVRKAARDAAPVESGWLKKNIVVRLNPRMSKQFGGIVVQVGIKGGARQYANTTKNRRLDRVGSTYEGGGNAFYWRFIEFGRGVVALKKRGRKSAIGGKSVLYSAETGKFFGKQVAAAEAKPFMRPALANNIASVTDMVAAELRLEIEKLVQP